MASRPRRRRNHSILLDHRGHGTRSSVIVSGARYLVRDVLLLIYVSGLLAIGFSPIVRLIERQKVLPIGTQRFPRWLAILVLYLFILGTLTGIGFMIVPPLVDQAQQLWAALPDMFERGQDFLIRKGLLKRAPHADRGGRARARRQRRRSGRHGRWARSSAWSADCSAC